MAKRRKHRDKRKSAGAVLGATRVAERSRIGEAAELIEAGRLDEAETLLEILSDDDQSDAAALHLLGLTRVRKGRVQEGLSMIDRSIIAKPDAAWMLTNRAAVLQGKGEHARAVEDLERATALPDAAPEAWSNLAASRSVMGDFAGAAAAAERAAKMAPKSPAALIAYGNTLTRAERLEEAVSIYRKALAEAPDQLNARVSLLQALQKLGQEEQAQAEIRVLAKRLGGRVAEAETSGDSEAHIDQAMADGIGAAASADAVAAMALNAVGLYDQALEAAERAIQTAPGDPHGWAAKGVVLFRTERNEEAIEPLERALTLRPDWTEIRGALGNVLWLVERTEDAAAVLERAVRQSPTMPSLWATLGAARRDLRDLEGAEAAYAKALELAPKAGKYALSLALTQLRQKKFEEGCRNYERRWETAGFADQDRPHKHPIWQGDDLAGKKILIYAEQGVGDEVMFAGMLRKLTDMGAAVYLEANARLRSLFERSFPGVVVGQSQNPPLPSFTSADFDCQAPGGALLGRLSPRYEDLKPEGAYLKPIPERVAGFRQKYRAGDTPPNLVVGIAWRSGNPTSGSRRTAELNLWQSILEIPGVRFVNLQYGDCADDIAGAAAAFGADIVDDDEVDPSGALDVYAAQIAAVDLVVSIDNSAVHFAGALGVPTLMLLNYEPDWRWFGADEGNPWYESVAHIRQDEPGVWGPVLEAAGAVVRRMAEGGPAPADAHPLRPAMVNRGAKPKALLLNDTTSWYHWGCTGTSLAIREQIKAKGYDLAATPIRCLYQSRPAPPTLQDFDRDPFFEEFVKANALLMRQIVEADRIVVNGEGTLHGLSENVRVILYLAYVACQRLGKPVQIINHSCYPEDAPTISDPVANGLYRKVYTTLEYAAFREHVSHGLMARLGVEGTLAFDSLPLTAKRLIGQMPKREPKRLVIAGSASADDAAAAAFAEYARWAAGAGWSVTLLGGARAFPALDERNFLQALARHGLPAGTELVMAPTLEAWMAEIARAGMVTTGRFHHSIAAFSLDAPFVAATSNTAKTNAIMQLLERPEPVPIDAPNLAALLVEAHVAALDNQEAPAAHAVRKVAVETLAMENYARL